MTAEALASEVHRYFPNLYNEINFAGFCSSPAYLINQL